MANANGNFFSIIAVGAFNPLILSKDFIEKECGYVFAADPEVNATPVFTTIKGVGIELTIELERFQIMTKSFEIDTMQSLLDLMLRYLEILAYTPLRAIGINFNYSVYDINTQRINDEFDRKLVEYFGIGHGDLELLSTIHYDKSGARTLREGEIRCIYNDPILMRFKFNRFNGNMIVNLNYEVPNLRTDRKAMVKLAEDLHNILENRNKILNEVFEGYGS